VHGLQKGKEGLQVCFDGLAFVPFALSCSVMPHRPRANACFYFTFFQVLNDHLKALQAASQQWQKTMMFASKR
jgi:hypothetical protein